MKALLNRILDASLGLQLVRSDAWQRVTTELQAAKQERLRKAPETMQTVFGHRMYANPGDTGLQVHWLAGKSLDEMGGEIGYIHRNVREGQTALDIGANIGLVTLVLARKVGPCGRVIAFEPGPVSFGLLKANVWMNALDHVQTENLAVADRTGPVDLMVCLSGESDNRISGALLGQSELSSYRKVASQCVSIDEFVKDDKIDFIKLDVQGAEYMALKGMQNTLRRNPELQMIVEYTPASMPVAPAEYLAFMQSFDFEFCDLPENGVEQPVSREWVLENIALGKPRDSMNLLLRRASHRP